MKKQIKFANELAINKETIVRLNEEQLQTIAGGNYGVDPTEDTNSFSCWSSSCNTKVAAEVAQ
jgi:hypothetical protein